MARRFPIREVVTPARPFALTLTVPRSPPPAPDVDCPECPDPGYTYDPAWIELRHTTVGDPEVTTGPGGEPLLTWIVWPSFLPPDYDTATLEYVVSANPDTPFLELDYYGGFPYARAFRADPANTEADLAPVIDFTLTITRFDAEPIVVTLQVTLLSYT